MSLEAVQQLLRWVDRRSRSKSLDVEEPTWYGNVWEYLLDPGYQAGFFARAASLGGERAALERPWAGESQVIFQDPYAEVVLEQLRVKSILISFPGSVIPVAWRFREALKLLTRENPLGWFSEVSAPIGVEASLHALAAAGSFTSFTGTYYEWPSIDALWHHLDGALRNLAENTELTPGYVEHRYHFPGAGLIWMRWVSGKVDVGFSRTQGAQVAQVEDESHAPTRSRLRGKFTPEGDQGTLIPKEPPYFEVAITAFGLFSLTVLTLAVGGAIWLNRRRK